NEQMQKAKVQTFAVKAMLNGTAVETSVDLGKWEQAYLVAADGKIAVAGEAPGSQSRAVVAFLFLCATLAYFAMRKPVKTE
ncbi:MAG TPA: hypothetical protein PKC25_13185, partial [Candidatus Rifleibacterium sp.]|nr:hypothetical protein [Candidatus Rifleibacterium sp.]